MPKIKIKILKESKLPTNNKNTVKIRIIQEKKEKEIDDLLLEDGPGLNLGPRQGAAAAKKPSKTAAKKKEKEKEKSRIKKAGSSFLSMMQDRFPGLIPGQKKPKTSQYTGPMARPPEPPPAAPAAAAQNQGQGPTVANAKSQRECDRVRGRWDDVTGKCYFQMADITKPSQGIAGLGSQTLQMPKLPSGKIPKPSDWARNFFRKLNTGRVNRYYKRKDRVGTIGKVSIQQLKSKVFGMLSSIQPGRGKLKDVSAADIKTVVAGINTMSGHKKLGFATKLFQLSRGLVPDGLIGRNTMRAMGIEGKFRRRRPRVRKKSRAERLATRRNVAGEMSKALGGSPSQGVRTGTPSNIKLPSSPYEEAKRACTAARKKTGDAQEFSRCIGRAQKLPATSNEPEIIILPEFGDWVGPYRQNTPDEKLPIPCRGRDNYSGSGLTCNDALKATYARLEKKAEDSKDNHDKWRRWKGSQK